MFMTTTQMITVINFLSVIKMTFICFRKPGRMSAVHSKATSCRRRIAASLSWIQFTSSPSLTSSDARYSFLATSHLQTVDPPPPLSGISPDSTSLCSPAPSPVSRIHSSLSDTRVSSALSSSTESPWNGGRFSHFDPFLSSESTKNRFTCDVC